MTKEVFQLEVQVTTAPALTGLNSLDKKLKDVKTSADGIGKGAGFSALTTSTNTLSAAFKGLGSVIAGLGLAGIAASVVKSLGAFQDLENSLTVVTGGATQAAAAIKLLRDVSATTPLSVNQLGESFVKLKAAGLEPTAAQLRLFADVSSVTTDKLGALQAITDLYARTTAGGLGLEEVNRLADRGIPVFDILAEKLRISRLQISELGKSAEGAQLILQALEKGLTERFGGAAGQGLNTINGQLGKLTENLNALFTAETKGGESNLTSGLVDLLKVLNEATTASDGATVKLGSILGDALRGLALTIKFVSENFENLLTIIGIIAAILLPFATGIRLVITNFALLTTGLSAFRGAWLVVSETFLTSIAAWAKAPFATILKGLEELLKIALKFPKISAILGIGAGLTTLGEPEPVRKVSGVVTGLPTKTKEEIDADIAAQERTQVLISGRDAIISKIVNNLKLEAATIGLSNQKAEEKNKILEAQAQIREKLATGLKKEGESEIQFQKRIDTESKKLVDEKSGEIKNAIALKYQAILKNNLKLFTETSQFEISLLGQSSNEIAKQNKLREIQLQLGLSDLDWAKEKVKYEKQITAEQNARINDSLAKNLEGIQKETEYLTLGNDAREKRIALDQAAADAGFKNVQALEKARPKEVARITEAIGVKQQTTIDVAGKKSIENLKEELELLKKTDELDRQREKTKLDIYKAIDPEGKGKKINEEQQNQITNLLAQIEAQNKLLEVNKKIEDGFGTLGSAITDWALGGENAIQRVKLALIQLIALQAFKTFAGGVATGSTGSFLGGVIGGLAGARAEGGPVTAGKSYLVGEKRPEIFVPTTNGYIVPNTTMMNTSTGTTNVTMAPNLIIQGSVTGQTELENMFDQFSTAIAQETKNFVISQRGQNGILAR